MENRCKKCYENDRTPDANDCKKCQEESIDRMDVNKCEGYKDKHCRYETSIMFTESNLCTNFPNCHYKQLKRSEQENKKLKEKLKEIIDLCKTMEDVKEEYIRIQLIKEIIEDKKDIHYYLEQNEMQKFIPNVAEIRGEE